MNPLVKNSITMALLILPILAWAADPPKRAMGVCPPYKLKDEQGKVIDPVKGINVTAPSSPRQRKILWRGLLLIVAALPAGAVANPMPAATGTTAANATNQPGFPPAVSSTSSRQGVGVCGTPGHSRRLRIGNPRYSRLEVCATALNH